MQDESKNGEAKGTTALAVREAQAATTAIDVHAMVPRSIEQAMQLAKLLACSNLVPQALRRVEDAFVVVLQGHELGLSPMQSIRGVHVIEGRPHLAAELMVALCLRRPDVCKYFRPVETSATSATYETHRVGHPTPARLTYTIEEAKQAGLVDKGKDEYAKANNNWRRNPADMLRARASSKLARMVYPDLLFGVGEIDEADEIRRIEDARPAALDQVVPPPRPANITAAPTAPRVVEVTSAPAAPPKPADLAPEISGPPATSPAADGEPPANSPEDLGARPAEREPGSDDEPAVDDFTILVDSLQQATSKADLEACQKPILAWPEGDQKMQLRRLYGEASQRVKSGGGR